MALYYQPKGCPVHGVSELSDADVKVPKLGINQTDFDTIAKGITDKTVVNKQLFDYTNSMLQKGIDQVWGDVKYNDKDFVFVERLKRNAAKFSGYKTATQTILLAKSKKEAYPAINNAYNNLWLRTEYVHTVRSTRGAKNWQKYEADKDLYPYLEYMPSSSGEPRSNHKLLYGVIKPLDDAFWNTWTPPSDWGCKCSVQQRRSDKGTLPVPENLELPPKALRNNTGKTGEIFSNEHPMIKAMGDKKAEAIDRWIVNEIAKPIVIKEYENGGTYSENSLMNKSKSDYEDLSTIANLFAKQEGYKVEIMPDRIHSKDFFYKYIFEGAYKNKLPDLKINGKFYEYKSYVGEWNKRKISNMIKNACDQSDRIIIDTRKGYVTDNYITQVIHNRMKTGIIIKEVWLLSDKEIRKVF